MIDPERARLVLREYHASTPVDEQIADTRRFSPELADRLGLNEPVPPRRARGLRRFLSSFGQSVHRLFS